MPDSVTHFEMRRLEALSNTIFGVAMTLLAYNLPKGQILIVRQSGPQFGSHTGRKSQRF